MAMSVYYRVCFGLIVSIFFAAALLVLPVQAHSRPVRFDPAPGIVLGTAPASVQGWFSSEIRRADTSFLQVLDGQGRRVEQGETQLAMDRRQMSVALSPGLPEGRYIVHWSALDDVDGHALAGCYVFFVGQAAAEASVRGGEPLDGGSRCPATIEAETPEPGEHDEAASSENNTGGDGVPVWTVVLGAIVGVVVGGVGGRLLSARP
jgi:methionine-rich copper-binding protein CopC